MQSVERILTILNDLVVLLWQIFLHTVYVLIPRPIRRLYRRLKLAGNWLWNVFGRRLFQLIKTLFSKIIWLCKMIAEPFIRFEKAFQEVLEATINEIKNVKLNDLTPQKIAGKILGIFMVILHGLLYTWKMTWGNMSNNAIAVICGLFVVCVLASWKIYDTGAKLYAEINYGSRKPASTFEMQSTLKRRPDYYKQESRHYNIKQLRIPVYIEAERSIKIFEVDTTIESSNRFVTRFFSENENLIRDRLLSTTEPMIHSFPLSDEGKQVMKEKIIHELTQFSKDNGIEGEVNQVYFNSIVAM